MGFLDDLKKNVLEQFLGGGEQQKSLVELATSLLTDRESGGLAGLAQLFQSKGLGDIVSSWIGTGQNQPVTGEQIASVFGSEQLQQFAQQLGFSREDISKGLAAVLPQMIDHLTPQGQMPDQVALEQQIAALKDKLFKA